MKERCGGPPTVVFLHALPFDGRMWEDEAAALRATHEVVVVPNLYRLGASLDAWAAAVLAMVQGPLIAVGCSVGGSTAYELARLASGRLVGLVIVGSKPGINPDPAMRDHALHVLGTQPQPIGWQQFWRPLFGPSAAPEVLELGSVLAAAVESDELIAGVRAFHDRADCAAAIDRFAGPIVVMSGEHDPSPTPAVAAAVVDRPSRRSRIIANSGHYVNLEQPEAFMAELVEALGWITEFDYGAGTSS